VGDALSNPIVVEEPPIPPYDHSKPPTLAFLIHGLDYTSSFAHFFPHPSDDEPFHRKWWMYLTWPFSALMALVISVTIKPLGLKPFIVVDRYEKEGPLYCCF